MNLGVLLQRTSLVLGIIALLLALWSGMHAQHILDNGGGRHAGELVVTIALTLLVFAGSWYGMKRTREG